MRAELDASLGTPKENPAGLNIAPTDLELKLTGKPAVDIVATHVDLPKVTITLSKITGTIELDTGVPLAPTPKINISLDLGTIKLDLGTIALHGAAGATDPVGVALDLDNTDVSLAFAGLKAALQGVVVLNGGQPLTSVPPAVPNPASIRAVKADGNTLIVLGQGFGDPRGSGYVVVMDHTGGHHDPTAYPGWTSTRITATVAPLAHGSYTVVVVNDQGAPSLPSMFTM